MDNKKTVYKKTENDKLSIYNAENQKKYKKETIRQINLSYSIKSNTELVQAIDRACKENDILPVDFAKQAIKEKLERDGYMKREKDCIG